MKTIPGEVSEIAAVLINPISLNKGHQYYIKLDTYYASYTQGYRVALFIYKLISLFGDGINSWQKISGIATASESYTTNDVRVGKSFQHDVTWEGYFDSVIVIDLTATFGSGNEPDKEWCDRHIDYFDGATTIYK